jgi:hypothetical protein
VMEVGLNSLRARVSALGQGLIRRCSAFVKWLEEFYEDYGPLVTGLWFCLLFSGLILRLSYALTGWPSWWGWCFGIAIAIVVAFLAIALVPMLIIGLVCVPLFSR